ncbi:MAG: metallophosphoesterase [Candidatus Thorarchaeota archaeon]
MTIKRLLPIFVAAIMITSMSLTHSKSSAMPTMSTMANHKLAGTVVIIRGPTVHLVTNQSVRIMWKTAGMSDTVVEFGYTDSNLNMSSINSTLSVVHRADIDGLKINTTYYYRVSSNGTTSAIYHFKTAPADGQPFKLIVLGDNRPGSDTAPEQPAVLSEIINQVIAENPDIVVMTGDYIYSLSTSDSSNWNIWAKFTNISDRLGHYVPIYAVIGNHDYQDSQGTLRPQFFLDAFEQFNEPNLYSSFDFAGVHFTILNSEEKGYEGQIRGEQWNWLVNDLTAAGNRTKFVFAHRPLYPLKHIGSAMDVNQTNKAALQQLFEDKNVTLFAAGHDHLFNRLTVNGVVHVITGGAGAPLYSNPWGGNYYHYFRVAVRSDTINMTSVRPDGTDVENYKLPYYGPIEIEIRGFANTSHKQAGTIPEILFSENPTIVQYSWDQGANTTTLTGIPNIEGEHSLDVYAQNSRGTWSHAHFVFTAIITTTSTTTVTSTETTGTNTPPPPDAIPYTIDPTTMMLITAGTITTVAVIIAIYAIYTTRRK